MSFMYWSKSRRWISNPEKTTVSTIQNISCVLNQNIKMVIFSSMCFCANYGWLTYSLPIGLPMGGMGETALPGGKSTFVFVLFCERKD